MENNWNYTDEHLLTVSEALKQILERVGEVATEEVLLNDALSRVLAEDIFAGYDLPTFSNSGMDGFAVRALDVQDADSDHPVLLRLVGDIPAGVVSDSFLEAGQAVRIMTGAAIPSGADAVVPLEQTDFVDFKSTNQFSELVKVFKPVGIGDFIRTQGQDIRHGQKILNKGQRIRVQDIGMLAMFGMGDVPVFAPVKVGLISSGDELVSPGKTLKPGKIFDSNSNMLASYIKQLGGEVVYSGLATDNESDVVKHFDEAIASKADLIVSSAGVSVGAFDYIRAVIEHFGEIVFWRVNMRPGKPLVFGSYKGIPLCGLPGNPVSAFVGFEIFVKPAIIKMSGRSTWKRPARKILLGEHVNSDGRESYLRAIIRIEDEKEIAYLTGHQGSGNLFSLVQANAFIIMPSEVKSLPIGTPVQAWVLDSD